MRQTLILSFLCKQYSLSEKLAVCCNLIWQQKIIPFNTYEAASQNCPGSSSEIFQAKQQCFTTRLSILFYGR